MILRASRGEAQPEAEIAVRETIKIRLLGIDKLDKEELLSTVVKIIDAGKESGVAFLKPETLFQRTMSRGGPISYLSFRHSELNKVKQQADELAMKDARAKADRIAKLAELSVGEIVSIEDMRPPSVVPSLRTGIPETRSQFEQIEVERRLRVRFALLAPEG